MATAEQLKSLIRSHFDEDKELFTTVALQLAAHEARLGHSSLAHEIRSLVDKNKSSRVKVFHFRKDLDDLIISSEPHERLSDLILSDEMKKRIERILREYYQREKLSKFGQNHRRKILLAGPPGTGKTMTATVLGGELNLPLYTILMDKLVTKYMGETSAKLRQIFEAIEEERGVYLFDEFDAIGAERGRDNEVGEMRRVLNAFLQFIEQDSSDSLIIAATNNLMILDQALFRRFDDVLHYSLPSEDQIRHLITNRLGQFQSKKLSLNSVIKEAESLSHAEITQACDNAIKEVILEDQKYVSANLLKTMIKERKSAYIRE